jgi:hypothetical protein
LELPEGPLRSAFDRNHAETDHALARDVNGDRTVVEKP